MSLALNVIVALGTGTHMLSTYGACSRERIVHSLRSGELVYCQVKENVVDKEL